MKKILIISLFLCIMQQSVSAQYLSNTVNVVMQTTKYKKRVKYWNTKLKEKQSKIYYYTIQKGGSYAFIAVGEDGIKDLDIKVINYNNHSIASDMETGDEGLSGVTINKNPYTREVHIKVNLYKASCSSCHYKTTVYVYKK